MIEIEVREVHGRFSLGPIGEILHGGSLVGEAASATGVPA